MHAARRRWRRSGLVLTSVALLGACGGPGHRDRSSGPGLTTSATEGAISGPSTPVTGGSTSPSTTGPGCPVVPNAAEVAGWSLRKKVALATAVPILDGDPSALQVAAKSGAGAVLLLGRLPSAPILSAALHRFGAADPGALVMVDEEGGGVSRLGDDVTSPPWPRKMASTMTDGQVQALGRSLAGQMRSLGVNVDLAPVVDTDGGPDLSAADPDGPRSFSPDPVTAGRYAVAFADGLQSGGVLATAKHFPGLGGASGNTDYGPAATLPLDRLESGGLLPFQSTVEAGVSLVMVSNASVPGLTDHPASVDPKVIDGLLRRQLHFGGLVVTDSLSAGALRAAGLDVPAAAEAALEAGDDLVLFGSTLTAADSAALAPAPLQAALVAINSAVSSAVAAGRLRESRLDSAVGDVLAAQHRACLAGS